MRILDDAVTGSRWLLERDPAHPGGPGRLVRIEVEARKYVVESNAVPQSPPAVIHAGDRIVVEEKTAVAEARLEAVAERNAAEGATLMVRLVLGGRVLRAVALAPGRARLEIQP